MPRALRKRNIYEEVARFLDIPGGQEIVQESYAQLRKLNCARLPAPVAIGLRRSLASSLSQSRDVWFERWRRKEVSRSPVRYRLHIAE